MPADMLALAEHILDSKRADFDPTLCADRYEDALVSMIKAKQAGTMGAMAKPNFKDRKVVDLMAGLKASLAGAPKPAERIKVKKVSLLPIAGGQGGQGYSKGRSCARCEAEERGT